MCPIPTSMRLRAPDCCTVHRTFTHDAIEGFGGKKKGRTFWELCGLVCGAGAGIEKCLEDRMNAGFLLIHYEKYR